MSEDEVTTGHANWLHKFRAEVATEAKLILATRGGGRPLGQEIPQMSPRRGRTYVRAHGHPVPEPR
eukprot:2686269-Pyramimonas_sp.AAC.1